MSTQATMKAKMGYRRTESDPANSSVNDIRCKFESTSDGYTSPEFGLSYGVKKSTPCSTPTSDASSPLIPRKQIVDSIFDSKGSTLMSHKQPVKQMSDSKLETIISKANKLTSLPETPMDKYKKAIVKPNSLIIPNGTQSLSKQLPIDKTSLIGLHNTGIVSSRKQQISSPITSPTVSIPCTKSNKLRSESVVKVTNSSTEKGKTSHEKKVTTPVTERGFATTRALGNNNDIAAKDTSYRHSMPEHVTSKSHVTSHLAAKQPAKAFWKSVSVDSETNTEEPVARVDSVFEPGMDYTKLKKTAGKNAKDKKATGSPVDKTKFSPKVTPKAVQLTANNLRKVSESLSDYKTTLSEESKSSSTSLSKSPSVSSTCSSMDSMDIDYINGPLAYKLRRRDTKPPQNLVARRTQLFEKSMDEINAVVEEAEAYNKVKEAGFGTVFTTVSTPSTESKPKTDAQAKSSSGKPLVFSNNNTKLANKNFSGNKPTTEKQETVSSATGGFKPLPSLPDAANYKKFEFGTNYSPKSSPLVTSVQEKAKGPPPKPPRTFEHPSLAQSSSNDIAFDPIVIPRQAGDGEENHDYEGHISCEMAHVYTSVTTAADLRPYTTTTSIDTRPYTSLTTTGGSGGDDSVAGSENAYDTLGRASVASSYEHYDTISASELDSDVSRPPTLPRRPSNLRHRPLTTAFSHLDINRNSALQNQLNGVLTANASTIKETSPTSLSPTKMKVPFKLKYLLPKARRKADEMRKASSMADLLDEKAYDSVQVNPSSSVESSWSSQHGQPPEVPIDEAGYALPDIKGAKRHVDTASSKPGESQHAAKSHHDKSAEKIRLKLNQAFSALRRHVAATPAPTSDGEDDERPPDPEVLEERLKHCTVVKERAIYASVEQIKGFMTRVYAQLYDYAVIVALRKNPDTNVYEPYVKYKFPPQLNVEQTTVPQFCYPDAHIWHKCTEYKSEAFSFVLTDVTGTRQYGYCKRLLPPDLNNLPRTAEVICVVSPLHAPKLYNQVLDEVEKRRMQSSIRAEEFLQAVYGRPLPSPGQSVTIRAMNVYEEPESMVFTRSPDSQREGIDYECLLNLLSVSQIIKIFASILLERKIIFIAEKLSTLSSCVHAFASLIYPFSWQHTFIPLLPPNLIDVVCAPTPFIVGLLSSNAHLLNSMDDEMEEVLVIDLDNHKFLQRLGDEKSILPKKLHRALTTALDMAKSESQSLRNIMVAEAFLRFFLETAGGFNDFMIHVPGVGRKFQKEEFVNNASNAPSIMDFLQWFTETQMFEVYTTERENDRNIISGTFEERVFEFQSEDHGELFNDSRRFKKFKLFGKNKKK